MLCAHGAGKVVACRGFWSSAWKLSSCGCYAATRKARLMKVAKNCDGFQLSDLQDRGRELVRTQCAIFLGIRRILHFLREKMGFQCWLSFLAFHESQPKGIMLTHSRNILPEEGLPAAKVASERLCRESLAMLMDGAADDSLEEALQSNPNMNAEDLLSTAALESSFMWTKIKELRTGEERVRLLAEASAAAAAVPAAPSPDPAPVPVEVDGQSGGPSLEDARVVEEEATEVQKTSWTKFFPDLIIPESMAETLSGKDEAVLARLHQFACARFLAAGRNNQ